MLTDPDKEFDDWIDRNFGNDPAAALMQKPKVTTGFSMDGPPVVKDGPAETTKAPEPETTIDDDQPFIDPTKRVVKVTEENEVDWSDASRNIVEFFNIIQAAIFGFVAMADVEERKLFKFDDATIKDLTRLTKPVAQKHNIKVEPEWLLGVMLTEIMVNNGQRAWRMRKDKNATAAREAAELAAAYTPEPAPTMQVVKDETTDAK